MSLQLVRWWPVEQGEECEGRERESIGEEEEVDNRGRAAIDGKRAEDFAFFYECGK